mmetsp:Transcript_68768/g.139412  ORF Transcript_68768/g.139412 Transcript_68768/m.139412 type:complete len:206 (-) Transcript_68768:2-619(-)
MIPHEPRSWRANAEVGHLQTPMRIGGLRRRKVRLLELVARCLKELDRADKAGLTRMLRAQQGDLEGQSLIKTLLSCGSGGATPGPWILLGALVVVKAKQIFLRQLLQCQAFEDVFVVTVVVATKFEATSRLQVLGERNASRDVFHWLPVEVSIDALLRPFLQGIAEPWHVIMLRPCTFGHKVHDPAVNAQLQAAMVLPFWPIDYS